MKTVYILGAGFSIDAGGPTQTEIIREAFRLREEPGNYYDDAKFSEFTDFLKDQLNIPEDKFASVDLEDIFTPLDRCLGESSQFRGIGLDKIMKVRESVFYVVGRTIQILLNETDKSKEYINEFAELLTKKSSVCQQRVKTDPLLS